jgi:phospholipase/carboxylesterase
VSSLDDLPYQVRRAAGEAEGALVLFHGRGADEHDLYPLIDALDPERRLLGLTPRAPLALPPGGAHWYVVRVVGSPDRATFDPTFARASGWLDALARETGIPPERTVLGGFSQGAVMAYALGLGRGRPRPAAIVALSGFLPTVEAFELDLAPPLPPIAIGHGTHDPVITVDFAREARRRLHEAGAEPLYAESPMGHSIDPAFLARLGPFVREAIERPAGATAD